MPTIEECIEHADKLTQDVVNVWGQLFESQPFNDDFKALLEVAFRYRDAKKLAGSRSSSNPMTESELANLESTRRAFAEGYKTLGIIYLTP